MTWEQDDLQYKPTVQVDMDQLDDAQAEVRSIPFSPKAKELFEELMHTCESEGLHVTNRRRCALPLLCKANAYLNGNDEVTTEDLDILEHAIWDDHDDRGQATRLVAKLTAGPNAKVRDLLVSARDVYANLKGEALQVVQEKLIYIKEDLKDLDTNKADSALVEVKDMLNKVNLMLVD